MVSVGRRIKAARALAGYDSVDDLAAKVEGMGATTLRKMERGERIAPARELREIADACGVAYEFFTIDFAAIRSESADGLESRVAALEEIIRQDVVPRLAKPHTPEPSAATEPERQRNTRRSRTPRRAADR